MRLRTLKHACICMLVLVGVSGCATDKPDIPRAELRKLLADKYGYERLDNGCFIIPPSGDGDEGQVVCPEVRFPEDYEDSSQ